MATLFGTTCQSAGGLEFYVSPDGSDGNPGTKTQPFQTIGRAQAAVRAAIAGRSQANVTVLLRGGKYYLEAPLTFDNADSPPADYSVTYRNYPNEEPIIVGGRLIKNWERHAGNVYRASVGTSSRFYTLVENGTRATMARSPNGEYARVAASVPRAEQTSLVFGPNDLPARLSSSDAAVYIWSGEDWAPDTVPISAVDWATRTIRLGGSTYRPIKRGNRYLVQGALELLDRPGEFFLSGSSGYLHYWPRSEPIGEQEILAPMTPRLLEIKGRSPDAPVRNLRFQGLTFSVTDYVRGAAAYNPGPRQAAIYVENGEQIEIRFCKVQNAGGSGVILRDLAAGNVIYGNLIEDFGVHGVWIQGPPMGEPQTSRRNRITNNHIRRGGQLNGFGSAIYIVNSGDNEIAHNKISDVPRNGVSLKGLRYGVMARSYGGVDVTWENHWDFLATRNNVIQLNDISRVLLDSEDGGGVEAWGAGKGNRIENNLVHDITSGVSGGLAFGIYLDDAADYFSMKNNIIRDITGDRAFPVLLKGIYNEFTNNVVINPGPNAHVGAQAYVGERNDHLRVTKNIFYSRNGPVVYRFFDWSERKLVEAENNLFYHENGSYGVSIGPERGRVSLEEWRTRYGFDRASVTVDPLFVDKARHDYRVRENSPALALGFTNIDQSKIGLLPDFPFER